LQKDQVSLNLGYSGMFIGGSRLSTRVRRSKSLPSNFLIKGWFCNNRNSNSRQVTKRNCATIKANSLFRKLFNQRKACWPRVLKQTSFLLDPFVCCKII
jgi:hypothetical protein